MKLWRNDNNRQRTYLLPYPFTAQPYGPLIALASFDTDAHSSPSTAFCRHFLTLISLRFLSTSSSQLSLDFSLLPLLLPSDLLSNIPLNVLPCSTLTKCPIHSSFFFQYLLLCLDIYISPSIHNQFLLSIFLALPPVHVPFLIFSCPMYQAFSSPFHSQPKFLSHTLQLVLPSF